MRNLVFLVVLLLVGCDGGAYSMNKGNQAYHRGDMAQAEKFYQQARQDPATEAAACYNLGRLSFEQQDWKAAVEYLSQDLERTSHGPSRLLRAKALLKLDQLEAAEKDLRQLTVEHPDLGEAWLQLARLKAPSDEAFTLVSRALTDPNFEATALLLRGRWHRERGKLQESLADLEASARLSPLEAEVHLELGKTFSALGDPREAARRLREALRLEPGNREARWLLAEQLAEVGDWNASLEHLEFLLKDSSSDEFSEKARTRAAELRSRVP